MAEEKRTTDRELTVLFKPAFYQTDDTDNFESSPFVGLRVKDNQIEFDYPEAYPLLDELKKQGLSLSPRKSDEGFRFLVPSQGLSGFSKPILSILSSISLLSPDLIVSDFRSGVSEQDACSDPILSCVYLIKDYLAHGSRKESRLIYQSNQGRHISWSRTKRGFVLIDSEQRLLFPNLIFSSNQWEDTALTNLYLSCVKYSAKLLGWLYGLNEDAVEAETIQKKDLPQDRLIIKKALSATFNDERRERLINMLTILQGATKNARSKEVAYGTDFYYHVFEIMVDRLFSNVSSKEKKAFEPQGLWQISRSKEDQLDQLTSYLVPDTILRLSNNELIIIDSKFYKIGSLPQSSSIEKQFTYAQHAKKRELTLNQHRRFSKIFSVFLLPNRVPQKIEHFGDATAPWMDLPDDGVIVPRIFGFYIDLRFLLECYHTRNRQVVSNLILKVEGLLTSK